MTLATRGYGSGGQNPSTNVRTREELRSLVYERVDREYKTREAKIKNLYSDIARLGKQNQDLVWKWNCIKAKNTGSRPLSCPDGFKADVDRFDVVYMLLDDISNGKYNSWSDLREQATDLQKQLEERTMDGETYEILERIQRKEAGCDLTKGRGHSRLELKKFLDEEKRWVEPIFDTDTAVPVRSYMEKQEDGSWEPTSTPLTEEETSRIDPKAWSPVDPRSEFEQYLKDKKTNRVGGS